MTSTPPDSGPPARLCTATLLVLLLLPACGGRNRNENRISPIMADMTIQAPPTSAAIYLKKVSATGDLVMVEVRLNTAGATLVFDSLNLEIQLVDPVRTTVLRPGIAQIEFLESEGDITPFQGFNFDLSVPDSLIGSPLTCDSFVGRCADSRTGNYMDCIKAGDPQCTTPGLCDTVVTHVCTRGRVSAPCSQDSDCTLPALNSTSALLCANSASETILTGQFLASFARIASSNCPSASINGDVKLLTLGILASTIGDVRLKFISNTDPTVTGSGHCGLLAYAPGGVIDDLRIPCDDGNALLTAHR